MGNMSHKLLKSLIYFSYNCVTLWNYKKIFELAILYSHDLIYYSTIMKLITPVKWEIYTIAQQIAQNIILVDLHCFKSNMNFENKIYYLLISVVWCWYCRLIRWVDKTWTESSQGNSTTRSGTNNKGNVSFRCNECIFHSIVMSKDLIWNTLIDTPYW